MNNVVFRQLTDSKLKIKGLNFTFDRRKIIIRDIPANRTSNGDILLYRSWGILILVSMIEKTCDSHPISSRKFLEYLKQIDDVT